MGVLFFLLLTSSSYTFAHCLVLMQNNASFFIISENEKASCYYRPFPCTMHYGMTIEMSHFYQISEQCAPIILNNSKCAMSSLRADSSRYIP